MRPTKRYVVTTDYESAILLFTGKSSRGHSSYKTFKQAKQVQRNWINNIAIKPKIYEFILSAQVVKE